jgi:phage-related protein
VSNFDAGTIEARLTLDRSQWKREMEAARAEGAKMEANGINVDANVQLDDTDAKARLEEIKAEIASIHDAKSSVDFNTADAKAKLVGLKEELKSLRDKHVSIDVDAGRAMGELIALQNEIRRIPNSKRINIESGNGVTGTQLLVSSIIAGLPLIPALAAPAAAGIGALASSLVAAGTGAGILGLGIVGAFKEYSKAVKDAKKNHTALTGELKNFDVAFKGFKGTYDAFIHATQEKSFGLMAQFFKILEGILPRLVPVFNAFATVASGALKGLGDWFLGPEGQGVLNWVRTFGAQQFGVILSIVGDLARGILSLIQAFSPFATTMMNGLHSMTTAFANWASTVNRTGGFKDFMGYVNQVGPMVISAFTELGRAIINIGVALAPLGPPLLSLITNLARFIGTMDPAVLRAIIVVVGSLVIAWTAYEAVMKVVAAATTMWNGAMAASQAVQKAWNYLIVEGRVQAMALAVAQGVARAATLAWTGVQWLLNAALTANPIGIVIVAIAALIAVLILAWQHSDTFRRIVIASWTAVKNFVIAAAGAVKNFVILTWTAMINWIVGAFIGVRNTVTGVWNGLTGTIRSYTSALVSAVTAYFRGLWSSITGIASGIRNTVSSYFNAARTLAVGAFNSLYSGVAGVLGRVRGAVANAASAIRGVFAGAGSWLWNAGWSIINGLINGIRAAIGGLQNILGWVTGMVPDWKGPAERDAKLLRPAGNLIMSGLIAGIRDQVGSLKGTLGDVTNMIGVGGTATAGAAFAGQGMMGGGGAGPTVIINNYNPVAEPSSVSAVRGIKDLSVLGVFSR